MRDFVLTKKKYFKNSAIQGRKRRWKFWGLLHVALNDDRIIGIFLDFVTASGLICVFKNISLKYVKRFDVEKCEIIESPTTAIEKLYNCGVRLMVPALFCYIRVLLYVIYYIITVK